MANILIVDDDELVRASLAIQLRRMDHDIAVAETLAQGLEMISPGSFDLVFLDVFLPDGSGLDALPAFRNAPSKPEVIIITGIGSSEGAEMAIGSGAWDYLQKPFSKQNIKLQLTRALDFRRARDPDPEPALVTLKRAEIIGSSASLNARLDLVAQCAKTDANVLITGETGTGKELFARVIRNNGLHPHKDLVVVDCAALPELLVESVLFGHVKGAFTGADRNRDGLIKQADGGTLFLDEIGELSLTVQKKFLRVLQERRFKPVGGVKEITSRFRLISATNRDLDEMVRKGAFRKDLLFRLRTFYIDLPPLRRCKADIRDLILHYIYRLCLHHGLENKGFVPEFMEMLQTYHWPGNVRELINTLEKTILVNLHTPILYPMHLPNHIRLKSIKAAVSKKRSEVSHEHAPWESTETTEISVPLNLLQPLQPLKKLRDEVMDRVEELYLKQLMASHRGDLDGASENSGLSKNRLYVLLKKHHISRSKQLPIA
ncbi:MAG: sigma-54-dependent Fis family transcriptional regulator [Deltaproteobacteria bacterium]|nr:sigma-54-dependent Fis family transcriptional regulator [Deltaproteobacteria bacterium]